MYRDFIGIHVKVGEAAGYIISLLMDTNLSGKEKTNDHCTN
jgi:hypothetical protein